MSASFCSARVAHHDPLPYQREPLPEQLRGSAPVSFERLGDKLELVYTAEAGDPLLDVTSTRARGLIRAVIRANQAQQLFASQDGTVRFLDKHVEEDVESEALPDLVRNATYANHLQGAALASVDPEGNHALDS